MRQCAQGSRHTPSSTAITPLIGSSSMPWWARRRGRCQLQGPIATMPSLPARVRPSLRAWPSPALWRTMRASRPRRTRPRPIGSSPRLRRWGSVPPTRSLQLQRTSTTPTTTATCLLLSLTSTTTTKSIVSSHLSSDGWPTTATLATCLSPLTRSRVRGSSTPLWARRRGRRRLSNLTALPTL